MAHPIRWTVLGTLLLLGVPSAEAAPIEAMLTGFEPAGKQARWVQIELPSGERHERGLFDHPADQGRVAWSKHGKTVISFGAAPYPQDDHRHPFTLYRLEPDESYRRLPSPPGLQLREVGFDPQDNVIAIVRLDARHVKGKGKQQLTYAGKAYPLPDDCDGGSLMQALRYSSGRWHPIESAVSVDYGGDYYNDAHALKTYQTLGVSTEIHRPLDLLMEPRGSVIEDAPLVSKLNSSVPKLPFAAEDAVSWARFDAGETDVAVPFFTEIGRHYYPNVVFLGEGKVLAAPLPEVDAPSDWLPIVRESYLLLTTPLDGKHPQVFDLRSRQRIFTSRTLVGVTFAPLGTEEQPRRQRESL